MSFNTPDDRNYTRTHEWIKVEGDTATVGITDYAQDALGDVVYIELPEIGAELEAGAIFGAIESVKAASDLYAPVAGTVTAVNEALINNPEPINSDPYGAGWMITLAVAPGEASLLDAAGYAEYVDSIKH